MGTFRRLLLVCVLLGGAGCAVKRMAPQEQPPRPDMSAEFTLDQIEPKEILSTTRPAASTTQPASLDALDMFAQAREAMLDRQRFTAISLLERAIALDPDSYELYYALGEAYQGNSPAAEPALRAFEKAVRLRPDDMDAHLQLGRGYLAKGDSDKALKHLRLAVQTPDYKNDDDGAAVVDYFLAKALRVKGYDRAALDQYGVLLERLQRPNMSMRRNRELAYLFHRPGTLYAEVAELQEKRGNLAEAMQLYQWAASDDPENLEIQTKIVRLLLAMDRPEEAKKLAVGLVSIFHANSESLKLIREVYQRAGGDQAIIEELTKLHERKPLDRAILFALADMLDSTGRHVDAEKMLAEAAGQTRYDLSVVRRLSGIYIGAGDVNRAAKLLVEASAARPQMLREISVMWSPLLRSSQTNHLRLSDLQKMTVGAEAESAKQFWISRVADVWNRDILARTSLEQAVRLQPHFVPAYRTLLEQYWQRPDWDDAQKATASKQLAEEARTRGEVSLAAELRGLTLLKQNQAGGAVKELDEAVKLGGTWPELQLARAIAQFAQGQPAKGEAILWKLVSDWPTYEDAYSYLFRYYLEKRSAEQAVKVLSTWLEADPESVDAKLLKATVLFQNKRADLAEKVLMDLFKENSDNAEVLRSMQALYTGTGRLNELIAKLEVERTRNPDNREVVECLVGIYAGQKQLAEALRVLDDVRKRVANDPDLLYYVSHLYGQIDQKTTTEEVLEQVVRLEPTHASACNDLGYSWADEGKNLERAEKLIRTAVEAEPDNESFLDSLGWVLYKRGRFEEACAYLRQAVGPSAKPDPVVLDHLGDAFYRVGKAKEAAIQWQRSLDRLDEVDGQRSDLKNLRLLLLQKLRQNSEGQPVTVAPR